jgi:hypothetical protein
MEIQEIDVFVDQKGEVKLEVRGVKGQTCLDLTQELEAILGGQVEARTMTPEADESQNIQVQQHLDSSW